MRQLSVRELADWLADASRPPPQLLDVREFWEFEHCHLADSLHIPMAALPLRVDELDTARDLVVICHHGARSLQSAIFLEHHGFTAVHNLTGGIHAWAANIDPAMPRY